jgi:hypothetical protein
MFKRRAPSDDVREEAKTLLAIGIGQADEAMSATEAITRAEWYLSQIEARAASRGS